MRLLTGTDALSPGLGRLGELWAWWMDELVGMLPTAVGEWLLAPPTVQLALPGPTGLRLAQLRRHRLRSLDRPDPALPLWLVLPSEAMLIKRLDWPLLPPADLRRSLALDLDRQTPFDAADVRFDFAVIARDPEQRRVTLDLAVIPESRLAPLMAQVADRFGLQPARVVGGGPVEAPALFAFTLAREPPTGAGSWLPQERRPLLLMACLVIALVNLALWSTGEEQRLELLDQAVREARARATSADNLRRQLGERQAFLEGLAGRTHEASLPRTLNELSRLLPDTAWLESVEIRGEAVHISGHAASAAALIGPLEASRLFAEAQFRAAVVPDRATGRERFEMTLALRPR
jgi:general secretion pathway protein L